jgi:nucleoside-diphosphate-sugar epimerase
MSNKTIVLTGASGFIGKHLQEILEKEEGLDVIPTSRSRTSGYFYVEDYSKIPQGDILIHLAGNNSTSNSAKQADNEFLDNLRKVKRMNFSRIVLVSSAVVYGDNFETPRKESDPVFVNSEYSRLKLEAEKLVLSSANNLVVRLSNVYGPGMSPSNVVSHIFSQLASDGPIEIENSCPKRDFVWVGDIADAINKLALAPTYMNSNIYNVGTGVATSIGELAKKFLLLSNQPEREVVSRMKDAPCSSLSLDISNTSSRFGWAPKVSLDDGLKFLLEATVS